MDDVARSPRLKQVAHFKSAVLVQGDAQVLAFHHAFILGVLVRVHLEVKLGAVVVRVVVDLVLVDVVGDVVIAHPWRVVGRERKVLDAA